MVKSYLGATFVASSLGLAALTNGLVTLGYAATIFAVGILLLGAAWEDRHEGF